MHKTLSKPSGDLEACNCNLFMVCHSSLLHPTILILHPNLHFVPLSKQLADLQEGGTLGFWDDHPNVDKCDEADESKDNEAVGPQAFL